MSAHAGLRNDAPPDIRRQRLMRLTDMIDHCEKQAQEAPDEATARAFARLRWELTALIPEPVE